MRRGSVVATLLGVLALVAACSGDDDSDVGESAITTTAGATSDVESSAAAPPTQVPSGSSAVAEAEGWRFVLSEPEAGATLGSRATVCYELTGTGRESIITLLPLLIAADGTATFLPEASSAVGRGGATVDLSGTTAGVYDLSLQVVVDGNAIPNLVVTVPDVSVGGDQPEGACR